MPRVKLGMIEIIAVFLNIMATTLISSLALS